MSIKKEIDEIFNEELEDIFSPIDYLTLDSLFSPLHTSDETVSDDDLAADTTDLDAYEDDELDREMNDILDVEDMLAMAKHNIGNYDADEEIEFGGPLHGDEDIEEGIEQDIVINTENLIELYDIDDDMWEELDEEEIDNALFQIDMLLTEKSKAPKRKQRAAAGKQIKGGGRPHPKPGPTGPTGPIRTIAQLIKKRRFAHKKKKEMIRKVGTAEYRRRQIIARRKRRLNKQIRKVKQKRYKKTAKGKRSARFKKILDIQLKKRGKTRADVVKIPKIGGILGRFGTAAAPAKKAA